LFLRPLWIPGISKKLFSRHLRIHTFLSGITQTRKALFSLLDFSGRLKYLMNRLDFEISDFSKQRGLMMTFVVLVLEKDGRDDKTGENK
jgi:hypothetical protein